MSEFSQLCDFLIDILLSVVHHASATLRQQSKTTHTLWRGTSVLRQKRLQGKVFNRVSKKKYCVVGGRSCYIGLYEKSGNR